MLKLEKDGNIVDSVGDNNVRCNVDNNVRCKVQLHKDKSPLAAMTCESTQPTLDATTFT